MKSSRREIPPWDAMAGAGMAMPALAHNIHVKTDRHAKTFYCPASHSQGIQLQCAVPAQIVNRLLIPSVTWTATGSITRTDMKGGAQISAPPSATYSRQKKRHQKVGQKEHPEDPAYAAHRPNPE